MTTEKSGRRLESGVENKYILMDAETLRVLPVNDRYAIVEKSRYIIIEKSRLYHWVWVGICVMWGLTLPAIFFAIWMGWLKG